MNQSTQIDPRKKTTAWKSASIVVSILLLASMLLNIQYFRQSKKAEEQFSTYINQVYDALRHADQIASSLMGKENWRMQVTDQELLRFSHALYKVHYKLQEGANYLDGVLVTVSDIYEFAAQSIVFGGSYGQFHLPPIMGKSALSVEEALLIEGYGELLTEILAEMDVGRQMNGQVKLSKHVFNQLMLDQSLHNKLHPLLERIFETHDELRQTQLSFLK